MPCCNLLGRTGIENRKKIPCAHEQNECVLWLCVVKALSNLLVAESVGHVTCLHVSRTLGDVMLSVKQPGCAMPAKANSINVLVMSNMGSLYWPLVYKINSGVKPCKLFFIGNIVCKKCGIIVWFHFFFGCVYSRECKLMRNVVKCNVHE